ncbi:MAG: P1 family peptidase, partial [Myxococcota bacterium]
AAIEHMVNQFPGIGTEHDVLLPVVGECDDSWLNDVAGRHVGPEHVHEAMANAADGPVAEGNVGAGTGMLCCDFKGGIGTSSRRVSFAEEGHYTVGILVMTNFGVMRDLRIDGVPVGHWLTPRYAHLPKREHSYGSIIAVLATDAPLLPHQLNRLCKRVALGIGRAGSHAAHGSGEIIVGFSTANKVPRTSRHMVAKVKFLLDVRLNPLYEAAIECTEEAILNSLCMATSMEGVDGHYAPELPLDELQAIMQRFPRPPQR